MIDYATQYLPNLSVQTERTNLLNRQILEIDKNNNEKLHESELAEYLTEVLPCYCVGEKMFFYNQLNGSYERVSDRRFKRIVAAYLRSFVPKARHSTKLSIVLDKSLAFAPEKESATPNVRYIAFTNCTIDIINRKKCAHSPKHFATNVIPHPYVKDADCPIFKDALDTIFAHDAATISAFWEMMGYLFYYGNRYPLQKIFIFHGAGSNGKSLILDVIRYMLGGGNYASARLDEISTDFGASHFYGKMLNISPETELSAPANTALLKSITGGDSVTTNFKHESTFSAQHFTKFIISANNLFPMTDTSHGMFRRLQIFPFDQTFVEPPLNDADRIEGVLYSDADLLEKIKPEVSGIINNALKGLFRLQKNNWKMTQSTACALSLQTVIKAFNPFRAFIEAHLQVSSGDTALRPEVIEEFYNYQQEVQLGQAYRHYSREDVGKNILQELQKMYPKSQITVRKTGGVYIYDNVKLV